MKVYRVRVVFSGGQGGTMLATHYFDGSGFQADAQAAANAVGALWGALDANMHFNTTWTTGTVVDDLNSSTGQLQASFGVTAVTGAGGQTDTLLPPGVCAVLKWNTDLIVAGKRIVGRTYIPSLTEASNTGGGLFSPAVSITAAISTYVGISAPNPAVVWSRKNNDTYDITSGSVDSKFAILQKRRS